MKAMVPDRLMPVTEAARPLRLADRPIPQPGPGEIRLRVPACGVCHTELDEIEGRTPPPRLPKEIKNVGNVSHTDLAEFLPLAAAIPIRPTVRTCALEQANQALVELKQGGVQGAKVLLMQ